MTTFHIGPKPSVPKEADHLERDTASLTHRMMLALRETARVPYDWPSGFCVFQLEVAFVSQRTGYASCEIDTLLVHATVYEKR